MSNAHRAPPLESPINLPFSTRSRVGAWHRPRLGLRAGIWHRAWANPRHDSAREVPEPTPLAPPPCHLVLISDDEAGGSSGQSSQTYRVRALLQSVRAAQAAGIRYFTLSTFGAIGGVGKRNLPLQSVLANLLFELISEGQAELTWAGVRVTTIGNVDEIPSRLRHALEGLCYATRSGTALNLTLAVAYTGRSDIVEATRYLAAAIRAGQVLPEEIDEQLFMSQLITHALPRVDLALFTACSACSDFLPFESAHATKISLGVPLAQFRPRHLNAALAQYARSQARQIRETPLSHLLCQGLRAPRAACSLVRGK